MGFVLLGIATLTPAGVSGALVRQHRARPRSPACCSSWPARSRTGTAPATSTTSAAASTGGRRASAALLAFAAVACLGLPGLAGFWGEMLALLGAYSPAIPSCRGDYLVFMALAGVGAVLTPRTSSSAIRRVCQGASGAADALADVERRRVGRLDAAARADRRARAVPVACCWSADPADRPGGGGDRMTIQTVDWLAIAPPLSSSRAGVLALLVDAFLPRRRPVRWPSPVCSGSACALAACSSLDC